MHDRAFRRTQSALRRKILVEALEGWRLSLPVSLSQHLSERERQVCGRVRLGQGPRQIARELSLGYSVVRTYISSIRSRVTLLSLGFPPRLTDRRVNRAWLN